MEQRVIIIGGGASGLAAGIQAARMGASVTILEHTGKPGKKLLSTGNGKCNLTNLASPKGTYRSSYVKFANQVLEHISVDETLDFFRSLGIVPMDRNGYVYPNSNQASSVVEALLAELEHLDVSVLCDCQVEAIRKDLTIITSQGTMKPDSVILAAGSKAAPKTGSDGSGYVLARKLGHHIIKPLPALVQLQCKEKWFKQAAGVRTEGQVKLIIDGKKVASDRGELQFTDYGISGIPVFQVSRFAAIGIDKGQTVIAELDLFPSMDLHSLEKFLLERVNHFGYMPVNAFLTGVLNKKLSVILLKEAGIGKHGKSADISHSQINNLVSVIKSLQTVITTSNPFEKAQVCSGGVDTREVDSATMESKLVKRLYLAGEILDVDGICGGYNLQWAWSSGILAGTYAGRGKNDSN